MKCYLIRDLLPIYLEGSVQEETRSFIEEHLNICSECKELLDLSKENIIIPAVLPSQVKERKQPTAEQKNLLLERYYAGYLKKGILLFITLFLIMIFLSLLK